MLNYVSHPGDWWILAIAMAAAIIGFLNLYYAFIKHGRYGFLACIRGLICCYISAIYAAYLLDATPDDQEMRVLTRVAIVSCLSVFAGHAQKSIGRALAESLVSSRKQRKKRH